MSLSLSHLAEMSQTVRSMQHQSAFYGVGGPSLIFRLDATLTRVSFLTDSIERLLRSKPATRPGAEIPDFVGTLTDIKERLVRAERGRRFFKQKSTRGMLRDLDREATEAERKLEELEGLLRKVVRVEGEEEGVGGEAEEKVEEVEKSDEKL